jgi:hypothetical protein
MIRTIFTAVLEFLIFGQLFIFAASFTCVLLYLTTRKYALMVLLPVLLLTGVKILWV